jgi:squalene-hopene/tetraprenyl-beta-curcumene cyclase
MNRRLLVRCVSVICCAPFVLPAQELRVQGKEGDLSLKLEIQGRIDRGVAWLVSQQKESGGFGDESYPAFTALALSAIMGDPAREGSTEVPEAAAKGYEHLLSLQKRDGGIYVKGMGTYNTALGLMALLHRVDDPRFERAIREARRFLVNQQADFDAKGVTDNELDGGIGYGGTYAHSDLSNTHLAMEALFYSRQALADRPGGAGMELDWDAALTFVTRTQNVAQNDLPYLAIKDEDRGGFVYFPGDSKAGDEEVGDKVALRSYGSMTYAGLLSFIYAQVDESDPRVAAARDWLARHYTVKENPGMEAQGLFYYYHTMAKALAVSNIDKLSLADGSKVDWKQQLALAIFDAQRPDGSWINAGSSRWMEDNPVLVTGYALLALEHIAREL